VEGNKTSQMMSQKIKKINKDHLNYQEIEEKERVKPKKKKRFKNRISKEDHIKRESRVDNPSNQSKKVCNRSKV
jgi:hypothetical protein